MDRNIRKTLGEILLLGSLAIALQQVAVPYPTTLFGGLQPASLVHLQAGFLLAVALLNRNVWVLGGCFFALWLGWMARQLVLFDMAWTKLPIGAPVYLAYWGWTALCARWMTPSQSQALQRVERVDLPRFTAFGLLVYPLGLGLIGSGFVLLLQPVDDEWRSLLQTFFAKQFGVLVLTMPLLMAWCERRSQRPWRLRGGDMFWLVVLVGGLTLSIWTAHLAHSALDRPAYGVVALMDYRFALFVVLGWCVLRLRPVYSMPCLSIAMMLLSLASAGAARYNETPTGFVNLLHIGFEMGVLQLAMLYLLVMSRDSSEFSERLADENRRDPVTGLPNLKALRERIARTPLPPGPHELGYLLLDRIDDLAPGFGLDMQARVMAAAAQQMENMAEPFLVGTGQFALLPHGESSDGDFWERLIAQVEQTEIETMGQRFRLLPYLGVARYPTLMPKDVDAALLAASQLAFEARGHNEVRPLHDSRRASSHFQAQRKQINAAAVALACLRNDRVELHFQPIRRLDQTFFVAGSTSRLRGEVLCRLRDEHGRMLKPGEFLGPIEAMGRGVELDLAVLRALFRELRDFPGAVPRCEQISVNLTGQSLASTSFDEQLRELLRGSPLPLVKLCFEITETAAIANASSARVLLDDLRGMGCRIAIDDFGTGMQSFARLKEMPVDIIKIDGSFIRNVAARGRDYALVQACVTIARAFNAQTVAEYVEDQATADCLHELGVEWMQGYLYSPSLPLSDVLAAAQDPSAMEL